MPDDSRIAMKLEATEVPGRRLDAGLPSGRYVRTAFFGPHSDLGEAWRHLNHRREQEGYQRRDGVSFEMYLRQEDNAPPDRVRTDLYAPIV